MNPAQRLNSALSGRYLVDRELGRGGMATVYLAQDLKHHRMVAIKVLHPELAAALGPERFLREIEIAASLSHPHILPLLDSGTMEYGPGVPGPYYVMPYVEGESLRDRLDRERQLSLGDAVRITREVADALDYAHARGLIHRDIKPENILLSGAHAVVADFGIARAVEQAGGNRLTETGLAVGTPDYMSPEQAAGDSALDGRTDQYSLGCVLYELLAGHPPFLGKNPQEVRARHALDTVPPLRAARATVSDGLEAVLHRALAKQPADRFPTVGAFVTALSGAEHLVSAQRPFGLRTPTRRRLWSIAAVLTLFAVGALIWRRIHVPSASSLDPNLLAVAPFEVLDPSLDLWREGMGDVLYRYLDGAGPLHTVSPTVVLRYWIGRADRSSAEALAQRIGAGLVVFGNAVLKGADSVLLRATVLRVAEGGAQDEIEVAGETERMGALADSLGHEILETLGRRRPIGAVRRASLGAGSLPALKAFLRGEQLYRDGSWDSALAQYDKALATDSGFALANRRMAAILWFYPPTRHSYQPWPEYALRARRLNHGLNAEDSLLIVALAHAANVEIAGTDDPTLLTDRREFRIAIERVADRYPSDPEVWYWRGELLVHSIQEIGKTEDPLAAFDRGIALDSSFSTLYEHAVKLALQQGGPDLARRYVNAYLALGADAQNAATFRLEAMLLDPRRDVSQGVGRLLDSITAWPPLFGVMDDFSAWPDSAETAVRVARVFLTPDRDLTGAPRWMRNPVVQKRILAGLLVDRGHLREAYSAAPETAVEGMFNPFLDLALFGVAPANDADADFRPLLSSDSLWPPAAVVSAVSERHPAGMVWWLARGDTVSLSRFAGRAESALRTTTAPLAKLQMAYLWDAARAYLDLVRGDTTAALKRLEALPDSVCPLVACVNEGLTRGRVLAASGRDREAAQVLDRWVPAATGTRFVLGYLVRGRVAERLDDREKAIQSYGYVVNAWRNADSLLQPYVTEARAGLARLSAEPRY